MKHHEVLSRKRMLLLYPRLTRVRRTSSCLKQQTGKRGSGYTKDSEDGGDSTAADEEAEEGIAKAPMTAATKRIKKANTKYT